MRSDGAHARTRAGAGPVFAVPRAAHALVGYTLGGASGSMFWFSLNTFVGSYSAAEASTGRAYVNFLGDSDEARSSYSVATYDRLVGLKLGSARPPHSG